MNRVLLVNVDSIIPNLALMKISAYYKAQGDIVGFNIDNPTHAYISCIFKKNKAICDSSAFMLRMLNPDIIIDIGGPGYDLKKVLPPAIEDSQPDYSLYPGIDYALGFTTRGCIRRCPFCIVPIKEGKLKRIQPIESIYRPEFKAIKLLDNNVLGDPDNFRHIVDFCEEHKLKLDVSQGLDIRLLTEELAQYIARIDPIKKLDFAYDDPKEEPAVRRGIELLKGAGVDVRGKVQFYVYCDRSNGPYGLASAINRCQQLKALGTNAYVMLNIDAQPSEDMKHLKRWANRKALFWSCDFNQYRRRHIIAEAGAVE